MCSKDASHTWVVWWTSPYRLELGQSLEQSQAQPQDMATSYARN